MLLLIAAPAAAADKAGGSQEVVRQGLPLKVANRTIIVLRGPVLGYTAEERVKSSQERIEKALAAEPYPACSAR